jgi:hypothetical protein
VKEITPQWRTEPMGSREVQDHALQHYMLRLSEAQFDKKTVFWLKPDKGPLATATSCTDCPKRTGNNPELFPDVAAKDTCTDPACNARKSSRSSRSRISSLARR